MQKFEPLQSEVFRDVRVIISPGWAAFMVTLALLYSLKNYFAPFDLWLSSLKVFIPPKQEIIEELNRNGKYSSKRQQKVSVTGGLSITHAETLPALLSLSFLKETWVTLVMFNIAFFSSYLVSFISPLIRYYLAEWTVYVIAIIVNLYCVYQPSRLLASSTVTKRLCWLMGGFSAITCFLVLEEPDYILNVGLEQGFTESNKALNVWLQTLVDPTLSFTIDFLWFRVAMSLFVGILGFTLCLPAIERGFVFKQLSDPGKTVSSIFRWIVSMWSMIMPGMVLLLYFKAITDYIVSEFEGVTPYMLTLARNVIIVSFSVCNAGLLREHIQCHLNRAIIWARFFYSSNFKDRGTQLEKMMLAIIRKILTVATCLVGPYFLICWCVAANSWVTDFVVFYAIFIYYFVLLLSLLFPANFREDESLLLRRYKLKLS